MCDRCDYNDLLHQAGLETTAHRLRVLEVVGNHERPLSAAEIYTAVQRMQTINRVTVYRILETFVQNGVVDRISSGGRAFFYGMAPNANHAPHPHFFCQQCGRMDCLQMEKIWLDIGNFKKSFTGRIENVEIRLDGICSACLAKGS